MELTATRQTLLKGLQRVQGIVEKRNTMPILSNVLIETANNGITLFATDLELGIRASYQATVKTPGAATVSARKLFEIIRELPEADIKLSSEDNHAVKVECARSRFKVAGLPPADFPVFPGVGSDPASTISRSDLLDVVRRTAFAVGENDARYVLNGVLCSVERGTMKVVGTDGHRLAVAQRPLTATKGGASLPDTNAIVPKKALMELKKLVEDSDQESIVLHISKTQMTFQQGELVLLARLMEGNYPNYGQVIPVGNDKRITLPKVSLEGALRRVALLSKERTNAVRFQVEPSRLVISTNNPDLGEAREDVAVAYEGETITTGFNARYLLDVLGAVSGPEVIMEFKDALSPCLMREPGVEGFLCVVMPMRV
ncbi:MAG: DNA polymerase III subunit beta [Nitrospirota bacterium]